MANSNNGSNKEIDNLRKYYIKQITGQRVEGKKVLKYLGPIDVDDIPEEVLKGTKQHIKGIEKLIEYHRFEMTGSNATIIHQWRLV